MNSNDFPQNPTLHKFAVTFASGYAKRAMEEHYDSFMESAIGNQLMQLNYPSKYAVEAALNGLAAYLSTQTTRIADTTVKQFLWEVTKNAPSEISKRMLNGKRTVSAGPATIDVEVSGEDERTVLDGLFRMEAGDLATFLSWLEKTSPEERRQMAKAMSKLTGDVRRKLMTLTLDQVRTLFALNPPEPAPRKKQRPADVQADLDAAHRRLDESLRERHEKRKAKP